MSANERLPLRPSLHRGNVSTTSVPVLDKVSSRSTPTVSTPMYQTKQLLSASDMIRTESADSHRSLRTKHSRKELKELKASAASVASTTSTTTKHKYSRSWEDESNDDDTRSISSFTCPFASEFDRNTRSKKCEGEDGSGNRQRFLDAVFRKLSQKTGLNRRDSQAWAATISANGRIPQQDVSITVTKVRTHFLDLSAYISPVPTSASSDTISESVTPKASDIHRFKAAVSSDLPSTDQRYAQSSSSVSSQSDTLRPTLRSRRSADNLGETRRLQREEWSAAAHNSSRGAATAESEAVHVPSAGMSYAMLARATNGYPGRGLAPVPTLPGWARDSNDMLGRNTRPIRPMEMARTASEAIAHTHRPVEMGRTASHDATSQPQTRLNRPVPMSRGVSASVVPRSEGSHQAHSISSNAQSRNTQRMINQSYRQPISLSPLSPQCLRSTHTLLEEGASPDSIPSPPSLTYRGSISSTASDSESSSCFSSVPQTPIWRPGTLPNGTPYSYDIGAANSTTEMIADEEENSMMGASSFNLYNQQQIRMGAEVIAAKKTRQPRPVASRSALKLSGMPSLHEQANNASIPPSISSSSSNTAGASVYSEGSDDIGNTTIRSAVMSNRPRASTTSSMTPTKLQRAPLPSFREENGVPTTPHSPSRSSSLQKGHAAKPSNASTISTTSTTTSSSSSSSSTRSSANSESILSYTRASPGSVTRSNTTPSPTMAGSPPPTNTSSSRTKRNTSKAEDWANSIGRRFNKGVSKATPIVPMPNAVGVME